MESTSACNSGNLDVGTGTAGSTTGTVTVQAGRYGNGLVFDENTDSVTAASSDFNRNVGAIEFWYQPFYNHNDGGQYLLWLNRSGSGPYDCFYFGKLVSNDLVFGVIVGATDQSCTIGGTTYSAVAPAASYSWRAYDWVHLKTSWNSAGPAGTKLRIVMNGVEIASSGTFVAPATSSTLIFGGCSAQLPRDPGGQCQRRPRRGARLRWPGVERLRHELALCPRRPGERRGGVPRRHGEELVAGPHARRQRLGRVVPVLRVRYAVPGAERGAADAGRMVDDPRGPGLGILERNAVGDARVRLRLHGPDPRLHAERDHLLDGRPRDLVALLGERRPGSLLHPAASGRGCADLCDTADGAADQD